MRRKNKTGNAMPLQAMVDAENSQVNDAAMARVIDMNQRDDDDSDGLKNVEGEDGKSHHLEKGGAIENKV